MEVVEKAIETTATIDAQRQLILDEPLPIAGPTRVRVIILLPDDVDINEKEWLRAASVNPVFDFLRDAEEDIYTLADGKPFSDKGVIMAATSSNPALPSSIFCESTTIQTYAL